MFTHRVVSASPIRHVVLSVEPIRLLSQACIISHQTAQRLNRVWYKGSLPLPHCATTPPLTKKQTSPLPRFPSTELQVYRWLDSVWPLRSADSSTTTISSSTTTTAGSKRKAPSPTPTKESWASRAYSAITRQQQTTGFDCGVASLLYAEKCGQGQMREDVDAWTTQSDMTEYRRALQRYVKEALRRGEACSSPPPPSTSAPQAAAAAAAGRGAVSPVEPPEIVVVGTPPSPLPLPTSSPRPPAGAVPVPPSNASAPTTL